MWKYSAYYDIIITYLYRKGKTMENNFKRKKIADGVHFSCYSDSRFKINRVDVVFTDTLDKKTASLNALIPAILSRSNDRYRTMFEFNRKLSGLYSANLGDYAQKVGDTEYYGLYTASLDDAYALDGESILSETVMLLKDCLFNPYLESGVFPEKSVAVQKQNLMDSNDNEINDKAHYTYRKGIARAYEGEPAAISVYGENEDIAEITAEAAYKRYLEILRTCNVEIMCVGPGDFSIVENVLGEAFRSIDRKPAVCPVSLPSNHKNEVMNASEKMDVSQSKLLMVFKTDLTERSPLSVMSNLFGGDVYSKLFMVVREKLSLCYYCYSRFTTSKKAMTVECGVENENIEKAKAAILEQLEEIRKGNFSDDDIKKAKLSMRNSYKSVSDRISSISGWYLNNIMLDIMSTPDEEADKNDAVSREDIIKAANSFKLDTVFVLTSEEEEKA